MVWQDTHAFIKLDIFEEGSLTQWTAFQEGALNEQKQTRLKKFSFRCRSKTRVPGENHAKASLDWKPNGYGRVESSPGSVVQSAEEVPLRYLYESSVDTRLY